MKMGGEFKVLVSQIEHQKLQFMGHTMGHRCIENNLLTEVVFGRQSGRLERRLINRITDRLGMTRT